MSAKLMVIDTPASVAILPADPERDAVLAAISRDQERLVSSVTMAAEAGMVLEGRFGPERVLIWNSLSSMPG